jgi:hypothetical protein
MTTKPAVNAPVAAPVAEMSDLEKLKALMAKFSKADIVKLTKEVVENKQTILSVTMDAIVAAGDNLITDNVAKDVTKRGRDAGVLAATEESAVTSVAQLIRHVQAYRAALKRVDDNAVEATTEFDASNLVSSATLLSA